MKKILNGTMILSLALASACTSDDMPRFSAEQGDEVSFTIVNKHAKSRTMYGDDWDPNNDGQVLYWGNYLEAATIQMEKGYDNIMVYCANAAVKAAEYKIQAGDKSNAAVSVTKTGAAGIQWGNEEAVHDFYAFYPAKAAAEALNAGSENTVNVELTNGQSPVNYRSVVGGNTSSPITSNTLKNIGNQDTYGASKTGSDNQIVTYGQPDMSAAIMAAHTTITPAQYGQEVSLDFQVLADVLDITVNGPITPNELNGDNKKRDYIKVYSIDITAKDPTGTNNVAICGKFDLDMSTMTATNVTNGVSTIQLQTAQVDDAGTYYPTLYVRSSDGKVFDQLRVRAFLIPGSISSLSQLTITVRTDCGDYTQQLTGQSGDLVSGQIHPIKLKYFNQRGKELELTHWLDQIAPDIYVNELSIPGTWYSYAYQNGGYDVDGAYTQNLTLEEQYNAGIRAFQFHLTNTTTSSFPGNLNASNYNTIILNGSGTATTGKKFEDVLNELGAFMTGHSTEFIVVNVSEDNSGIGKSTWLQQVANVVNNNSYVYGNKEGEEITANTTIQDVLGKIIVHVNTASGYETLSGSISAIVSRWQDTSAKSVLTSAMKWGGSIAPTPLPANPGLQICYSEAHRIGSTGTLSQNQATLAEREAAITTVGTDSYNNYKTDEHRTWYYCTIGGVLSTSTSVNNTTAGAQNLAKELNPYTLQVLSNPLRQACPMGMIMMNFAAAQPGEGADEATADPYSSAALIRTIINNNQAFILNKATSTNPAGNVEAQTNSHFSAAGSGNAFGK